MNKQLEPMNASDLKKLLLELYDTEYFQALIIYRNNRRNTIDQALRSIDPVKNAVDIARNQGYYAGLGDVIDFIITEKEIVNNEVEHKN